MGSGFESLSPSQIEKSDPSASAPGGFHLRHGGLRPCSNPVAHRLLMVQWYGGLVSWSGGGRVTLLLWVKCYIIAGGPDSIMRVMRRIELFHSRAVGYPCVPLAMDEVEL